LSHLENLNFKFLLQFERQLLAATLLIYHTLIWSSSGSQVQPGFILILYGLFLLWQPLWNKESHVSKLPIVALATFIVLISYFFTNESLVFFGLMLSGLIGSRLLSQPTFRSFDLLGLLIVILEMATGVIPRAFPQIELPILFSEYMQIVILVPILLFFFASNPDHKSQTRSQVDLMHGLLTSTLIFIVLLGAIVINTLYGVEYIDGFLLNVFIVSTLIIGISWFWNPGVGYSGIGVLWNRYAMTIGGPFETWINTLTTLIEEHYLTPNEYLEAACEHLVENDWLNAIQWNFENSQVSAGEKKGTWLKHAVSDDISVELYFTSNPGTALEQHTILLIRMAYQFYLAKLNQEKMRAQEHFATIHHTGARLTHDIKNILQSIKTSLDILNLNRNSEKQQALLQKNLIQISSRLENTLCQLKAPNLDTHIKLFDANEWMDKFEQQYNSNSHIHFHREVSNNTPLPIDLFDSVVENLINNAIQKRSTAKVDVRLHFNSEIILLSVCDDGSPVESIIEASLFNQPVSSGNGMGIGLYQSAIMARAFNFELELSQNEAGKVCFNLFQLLRD
jgi:signal transduction histidine kinase